MMAKLGDICNILDSQRKPVSKSNRQHGDYPYYGANGIQDYVDKYLFDGEYLLLGEDGSVINKDNTPVINWAKGKIWVNNHAHVLSENKEKASLRYIYHALHIIDVSDIVRGVPPKINQANMREIEIPLPSLSEQQRIVDILDKFEGMVENVEKELLLRQKQYEFYREKVMQFDEGEIEWKTLDNIFDISAGGDVPVGCVKGQKQPSKECPFPVFSNGKEIDSLYGYSPINKIKSKAITIAARGSIGYHTVREANFTPIVRLITLVLKTNTVNIKYVNQYLYVSPIFGTEGGIPQLTVPMVKKIEIPIPYLDKQQEIVAKLDKFEEMISTLKKELELRKKQYEYYREKLLTFE